jgi:galactose mutarotase-like enzyme
MAAFSKFPMEREIVLSSGKTLIGVMPDICLVSHFQVGAWPVLYRAEETGNVKRWGLPWMIPNFSRLKDGLFKEKGTNLPAHGFGRNLPWNVIEQSSESLSMQLLSSDSTRASYPYEFTFTSTIQVSEGILTYIASMENRNEEVMPTAPGFHPYFSVSQGNKARLITDGPTGFAVQDFQWDTNPPNNPYPFPHKVTVQVPDYGTLTISEEAVKGVYSLKTMQVWSEPVTAPDHAFVCFEPVVTSEDGLNRPEDRLNIPAHSTQQIILHLHAEPR